MKSKSRTSGRGEVEGRDGRGQPYSAIVRPEDLEGCTAIPRDALHAYHQTRDLGQDEDELDIDAGPAVTEAIAHEKRVARTRSRGARDFVRPGTLEQVNTAHAARAAQLGVRADLAVVDWIAVLVAHDERCLYCGAAGRLTLDHMIPIADRGEHSVRNVVPACGPCNSSKGVRPIATWLEKDPQRLEAVLARRRAATDKLRVKYPREQIW